MEEPPKHPDVARIFTRLLESVGLNARQFAQKIGSTPQAISNYMVGRNEPGRKMLAQIIEAYPNIDAAWLTTGEGEPFPNGRHNEKGVSVAHTRAHGEARATAHPTVQPVEKELAAGQASGPYLYDDDPVVQQLLIRLAEKDRIIERQQEDIDAWRDAFRKPLASADAAAPAHSIRRWQSAYAATATEAAPECRVLQFRVAA